MKRTFIPRARLVSILGDQLIKDDVVGLLELVKNGYDADAKQVTVSILNTANPEKTEIKVQDDGDGMDLDTIENHWLQPASGHKETAKQSQKRSRLGRLPQGEKGVGRFAVQRLGRYLTVVTRKKEHPQEIVIQIDWNQFEEEGKRLSDVEFDVTLREPQVFVKDSGTLLHMKDVRTPWTERNVKKVQRYLERMMSPFQGAKDFFVKLECPEYPHFQKFNPSEITNHAHARFSGTVDSTGKLTFNYHFAVPGFEPRDLENKVVDLVAACERWDSIDRSPACGPFKLKVFLYHRSPEILNLTPSVTKKELDDRYGIHVYRDGIRVLPFGEPGNDWLDLDQDRINVPAGRLGNKNFIGMVELLQDKNQALKDKTNREGLVENQAFIDFRLLVQTCINVFTSEFKRERNLIKDEAKAQRKAKQEQLAEKREELAKQLQTQFPSTPTSVTKDERTSIPERVHKQVVEVLRDSDTLLKQEREAFETERQALLSLAGLGFTAERFAHEFARLVDKAEKSFASIEKRLGENDADALAVRSVLEALRSEIRGLEPLMYVSRRKRQPSSVMVAVENAVLLNEMLADHEGVQLATVRSDDFTVRMPSGALTQVLNNLLDNAIYWTSRHRGGRNRSIEIQVNEENSTIIVRDSGPGVAEHLGESIFDPFITQRTEGRGLGLWICRQVLAEESCTVNLLPKDPQLNPLGGAAFIINLAPARMH